MSFETNLQRALEAAGPAATGEVTSVVGLQIEVEGIRAAIGDGIQIATPEGPVPGEVVALRDETLVCMPYGELRGVCIGSHVEAVAESMTIPIGTGLLGRVVNALGQPIDDRGSIDADLRVTVDGEPPHPLRRSRIDRQLPLGVRAMDTLVPVGRGQRLGIFAGSGVGKSSLLSMIARGTEAQVSVIALVGERGREVREFIEQDLGPEGLSRSVVVVATSDEPALVRLRAAFTATRIAEWFRDAGADVVLMMDSVTRFCMAQREIGLAAGEPPATRGYPPSVFSLLPKLLERAGAGENGSITGLYTVLVDGDDMNEPIADAARSILDGHVVLSRKLATAGHFPSIDVLESISRLTGQITNEQQRQASIEFRKLMAAYRDAKDLIEIGAYVSGTNPDVDRAIELQQPMNMLLRQSMDEITPADISWQSLIHIVNMAVSST